MTRVKYLWCGLFLALAACGGGAPVTQSLAYVPPATPGGRMCIDQCAKSRDYCHDTCTLDYRACYNDVQIKAQHDYDHYALDRFASRAPVDMMPSDFEHPEACNAAKAACVSDCDRPYNACYHECGGAVAVTSSCQFLCFQ